MPHRRQRLLHLHALAAHRQFLPACGDCSRGDDYHLHAVLVQARYLAHQLGHHLEVEAVRSCGEEVGAEFGDDSFVALFLFRHIWKLQVALLYHKEEWIEGEGWGGVATFH